MAKINQIENAIKELDGGAFQKLADSYLLKKGYPQINPIGSAEGSNKVRKGTPDTLILTSDGMYIFAEYATSAKSRVFSKFSDDIAKCLDETKTGISINKIREIVLCYTSEMSPENIDKLRQLCEPLGVNLNLYSLGSISYDLYQKYPILAKDYLGVEVDTGQIVELDNFIALYEKNKLTTTLKTDFHFREEEKGNLLSLIENNNLVIISGQAGVGKSRLAIECYQQFIENNKAYKSYCIFNYGIDLFEDVRAYFSDSGDYLIFVDDANRISGFQYIVQLLQTKRSDQNFKIIVTVREYALDKIRELVKPFDVCAEISLKPFSDNEIEKLLQDDFGIKNTLYLKRIIEIAHGNPRLAIMAAKVAKERNELDSIKDVSEVYEAYFSSIKSDLDVFGDKNILKVIGIVAFFRNVDRTNISLMSNISAIFSISVEDFWEASKILHDMEVFDMFENEVVKISDQVLSTYLFYLVFFKEKIIDFSMLLNRGLFPQYKQRLIDAINPILNTFNVNEIKRDMELSVDDVWGKMQKGDESTFLELMDVFWFLKPTETLIYIQEKIASYSIDKLNIDDIVFEANSNSSLPDFMSPLLSFRYYGLDELNISLDLFLKYIQKQPQHTSKILSYLVDSYGFQADSYSYRYDMQDSVVDKLLEYCDSGKNEFFTRIFISLAERYLHTHFSSTSLGRNNVVTWTQFDLVESVDLINLRKKIWVNFFTLFKNRLYQQPILNLLLTHTESGNNVSVKSIIENDSKLVVEFLNNELDPTSLSHCIVAQQYLRLLKRFKIEVNEKLNKKFKSTNYGLYDLLTNKFERIEQKLGYREYTEYKKKKLAKETELYSEEDYSVILKELFDSLQVLNKHSEWQLYQGVISIFETLANRDECLYSKVVSNYLQQGEFLKINPWDIVFNLIIKCGSKTALKVLSSADFPTKNHWVFSYYQHLPEKDIQQEQIEAFVELYSTSAIGDFVNHAEFVLKYESVKNGFIVKVSQILVDKAVAEPEFIRALSLLFNKHTEINKQLISLFSSNLKLLEELYIAVDKIEEHADYDGTTFSKLLDEDQSFIGRYLAEKFSKKSYLSRREDGRDYSFIWLRADYTNLMKLIADMFLKHKDKIYDVGYFASFFNKGVNPQKDVKILEIQDSYFIEEINNNSTNSTLMSLLFNVISGFDTQRKIKFYNEFLGQNKCFEDFEQLRFQPASSSWSGSRVPLLQKDIEFYEQIISLCNSVQFLKHKQLIEQRVKSIRLQIQHEKKRDFTEEF